MALYEALLEMKKLNEYPDVSYSSVREVSDRYGVSEDLMYHYVEILVSIEEKRLEAKMLNHVVEWTDAEDEFLKMYARDLGNMKSSSRLYFEMSQLIERSQMEIQTRVDELIPDVRAIETVDLFNQLNKLIDIGHSKMKELEEENKRLKVQLEKIRKLMNIPH